MQLFNKRDYLRYYLIVKVQRNFILTEILFREQCPTCWPPFNFNKYVNTLFLLLFCLCSHCPIFLKLLFSFFPYLLGIDCLKKSRSRRRVFDYVYIEKYVAKMLLGCVSKSFFVTMNIFPVYFQSCYID